MGQRGAPDSGIRSLPTGTVSFLFTDIEGSTELLQRVGDLAYGDILETHHRLMRTALEGEGGHEVDTQGDAFFVAFPDASKAVAAAVAAQRAFAAHAWPPGVVIRVRMGMHTGEPTLGPGGYVGIDVHRAARVCSAGYGGQVIISERTRSLAEHALPEGVELKDLGEHRLKDLTRPEHIFQVIIPGLPAEFPPLKSLDIRTTNLPALELTSFIGREQELAEVKQRVSIVRLVTLMGPGGAGKTRLSLQVAADLLEQFSKGVWLVELAPLRDPDLVVQTVASVLGVRESPGRSLLDLVVDFLRARDLLLILDNCEHLTEACARLAHAILRGCPNVRILATSREALGVAGEVIYRVPLLASPDPARVASVADLMQFDAGRLFIERAVISNPAFVATDVNAPTVAHIIRCLDGLPLAIELAAARVKVLSVNQIAQRLAERFRLLTSGARAGLPHHQTLRATVDWSYDLLNDEERTVFRRLAVFAGGFALEAAERICASDGIREEDMLDLVSHLADKSLLVTEIRGDEIRYRMLETILHYSRERLQASGDADAASRRHLEWYLDLAERAEPALQMAEQIPWLERLEPEHDNLRAALEWASYHDAETGMRLAGALLRFWLLRGFLREGREWLESFLDAGRRAPVRLRAKAAYGAGLLAFDQGDTEQAAVRSNEGLSLFRELGDAGGVAPSLNLLAIVARNRGDYKQSKALLEESLDLSRTSGNRWALAEALNVLGVTKRREGDLAAAETILEESLGLWRTLGDTWGLAFALGHLGVLARQQGDYARARALHEESLALRRQLGDRLSIASALNSLGVIARHLGEYEQARLLLEESLVSFRELGVKMGIAATLSTLGLVLHRQGESVRARSLLEESLALSVEQKDRLNTAAALCNLGMAACAYQDYDRALGAVRQSLDLYRDLGNMAGVAESLTGRAQVAIARGEAELAVRMLAAADVLRQSSHIFLPPSDRAEYDRLLTEARTMMSEVAFDEAWARGQGMSVESALADALR